MKNSKILILEKKIQTYKLEIKISLILNEVHFMHLCEPRFFQSADLLRSEIFF